MPPRVLNGEQISRWSSDLDAAPGRWWLAESNETVVGFAGICSSRDPIDPGLGELDTIAVAPTAWRRGVGRRLMDRALEGLRAADYLEGILWTLARHEQGRTFYEATGWRVSGEVRDEGHQVASRRSFVDHPAE